jgi:pyrimidine deaminase RibD-like protein
MADVVDLQFRILEWVYSSPPDAYGLPVQLPTLANKFNASWDDVIAAMDLLAQRNHLDVVRWTPSDEWERFRGDTHDIRLFLDGLGCRLFQTSVGRERLALLRRQRERDRSPDTIRAMRYSRQQLAMAILAALAKRETAQHKSNLIGNAGQAGLIDAELGSALTLDERGGATRVYQILFDAGLIQPSFQQMVDSRPEDWVVLTDTGRKALALQYAEAVADEEARVSFEVDRRFMKMAVDEARKSVARREDDRVHPAVGVVVARGDALLAVAHRGEQEGGQHAEFTALERKLAHDVLAGSTVYTTLEPCTSRNEPKIACVDRLIERKVARVFIGMLDPDTRVHGRGMMRLQEAGIDAQMFSKDLTDQVQELNREFIRDRKMGASSQEDRKKSDGPPAPASQVLPSEWRELPEPFREVHGFASVEEREAYELSLDARAQYERGRLTGAVDGKEMDRLSRRAQWSDVRRQLRYFAGLIRDCDQEHRKSEARFRHYEKQVKPFLFDAFGQRMRDRFHHAVEDDKLRGVNGLNYGDRALDYLCHVHANVLDDIVKTCGPDQLREGFRFDYRKPAEFS